MNRQSVLILLVALAIGATACNRDAAYTPGELAIEARFRGVEIGGTEQDVRARLGAPVCVLFATSESQEELEVRCPESAPAVRLRIGDRSTWPPELPGLPSRRPAFKALVYVDAAISAYYHIDNRGRVEFLQVQMT